MGNGIQNGNLIVGSDTSRADGSFELKYKLPKGVTVLIEPILIAQVGSIVGVPSGRNLDSLEIYSCIYPSASCILNVKLNVQNPYSNADTLRVSFQNSGNNDLKIAGQFTSGIVHTVSQYPIISQYYTDANHHPSSTQYVDYKLNNSLWQREYFTSIPCQTTDVTLDVI